MTQMTITAQVRDGLIHPVQSVALFEGQCVTLTLTAMPQEAPNGKAAKPSQKENSASSSKETSTELAPQTAVAADGDFDPEPPEWLEVENDVYFPMTVPEILLPIKKLIVERGTPCIILPEELPDD